MRRAVETHTLQFEVRADQFHQVDSGNDTLRRSTPGDCPSGQSARAIQAKTSSAKKGDLAFVIVGVVEESIATKAAAATHSTCSTSTIAENRPAADRDGRSSCGRAK
jgi:hypothetical protein